MKLQSIALATLLLATGCSTVEKDWSATGGSKADGVVRLSYEINGVFEKVKVQESQAIALAEKRCSTWGYSGAEAFGGFTKVCTETQGLGGRCVVWLVTKEYQCTGSATK